MQTKDNFTKELAITSGKMPPNAVEIEFLIIGTLLIDSKAIDIVNKSFLKIMKFSTTQDIRKFILPSSD